MGFSRQDVLEWGAIAFSFSLIDDDKESACDAGDLGLIPGVGRSPGEGNDNPLHYSCLENPMDREIWQVIVGGLQSQT